MAKSLLGESLAKIEGVTTEIAVPVKETILPPYVGSYEKSSNKGAELAQAGVAMGSFYLALNGRYIPMPTLQFHLLNYRQFWTTTDDKSVVLEAKLASQGFQSKFQEHFEAVLLVYANGELIPAHARFRGAKSAAGYKASVELEAAQDGKWASKSPEHKIAAGIKEPWARFVTSVVTQKNTAKKTGLPYWKAIPSTAPTNAAQAKIIQEYGENAEENSVLFASVFQVFNANVQDILGKVK